MASAAEEKKKIVDYMNQTLNMIENRKRELNINRDKEQDPAEIAKIDKDLAVLEQQMTNIKGVRDDFEQQYKKLKTEEERKELERIIKMAIIVGITGEAIREAVERDKKLQNDKKMVRAEIEERAIDRIFTTMTFRFVTREMIDEIKNNKKFQEMAANDPDRLNREEFDVKAEYNTMMMRIFSRSGEKLDDDFEKNEERLRAHFEEKNGFEKASDVLRVFVNSNIETSDDEEDKKFFEDIQKEILEVGAITRKLRNEFVTGESNFLKGNGFTKELIQRERNILEKTIAHRDKMIEKYMVAESKALDGTNTEKMNEVFETVLKIQGLIEPQIKDDEVLSHNNEFRTETEMWKVYQNLPEGSVPTVQHMNKRAKEEIRAWTKLNRISKVAILRGKGSMLHEIATWSMGEVQEAMEKLKTQTKFTKEEKKDIKERFASLVLFQLVENETKSPGETDTPFYDLLKFKTNDKQFLKDMAKKLSETPEFEKSFNSYMKRRTTFRDNCVRFLAEDGEKTMAKQLAAKAPTLSM